MSAFALPAAPGLFLLHRALTAEQQLQWAGRAVQHYSRSQHTNLTNLASQATAAEHAEELERLKDLWRASATEGNAFARFKTLRWASLGYHYDWTARCYQPHALSPFPAELTAFCRCAADCVGETISPEAAIVNFYPMAAQMCGHLDDAEHCMTEPIVSLSLGRAAIFLIGGRTKDSVPTALLLRGGDVLIMAGESRFCYHGVPAILSQQVEELIFPCEAVDAVEAGTVELEAVKAYLEAARVNINARRVTNPDGVWVQRNGSGYTP